MRSSEAVSESILTTETESRLAENMLKAGSRFDQHIPKTGQAWILREDDVNRLAGSNIFTAALGPPVVGP